MSLNAIALVKLDEHIISLLAYVILDESGIINEGVN